jgi:hypothetical protein
MGGFDCICMTGVFNVRFVHLASHELSWHQNVKNVALQCENIAKTNHQVPLYSHFFLSMII